MFIYFLFLAYVQSHMYRTTFRCPGLKCVIPLAVGTLYFYTPYSTAVALNNGIRSSTNKWEVHINENPCFSHLKVFMGPCNPTSIPFSGNILMRATQFSCSKREPASLWVTFFFNNPLWWLIGREFANLSKNRSSDSASYVPKP